MGSCTDQVGVANTPDVTIFLRASCNASAVTRKGTLRAQLSPNCTWWFLEKYHVHSSMLGERLVIICMCLRILHCCQLHLRRFRLSLCPPHLARVRMQGTFVACY
jgi:hypothetical protein